MSEKYSQRPSELLGLSSDPYTAWCIDEVAYLWGQYVESEVKNAAKNAKKKAEAERKAAMKMTQLMRDPMEEEEEMERQAAASTSETPPRRQRHAGKFRDPATLFGGRTG